MNTTTRLQTGVWALNILVVALALFVWWPATKNLTTYSLFPIFGLIAFSLMWVHYITGALRRYASLSPDVFKRHFQVTGYIVLFCILAHPGLLDLQLYLDGLGLPFQAIPQVYPRVIEQVAILAGVTALTIFLFFELHRFFKDRTWWRYVEWANIAAMALILWHGFTLGGDLRQPWFQVVWALYAITFVGAVAYTEYDKRRTHGAK